MVLGLEKILSEKANGAYDGNLGLKYSNWLKKFAEQEDFSTVLSQKIVDAREKRDFKRFNFLVFIIQGYGNDSVNQKDIYFKMMDFINENIEPNEIANEDSEVSIELTLDVFWHQPEGLKKLNLENQVKLYNTLKRSATFRYVVTENGEEPFFAIKKSMDLIKFQDEFGNSKELWNLFGNHFDPMIISEYKENIKRL